MEHVLCALCGTDEISLFKKENGYRAVQCDRCGLVYVDPRPNIAEMKRLYEGQETHIDIEAHMGQRDLKSAQAKRSLSVIRRYRTDGKILEVGSAAGYFLWEARKFGFQVQGVELIHQLAEFSRTVLNIPTIEGTLRQANLETGQFDIVYMRNVISHLAYPVQEFELLWRLLRPGGYLVFETGNVAELSPQEAGELELPDHLYHYSETTIRKLLDKTKFDWVDTHRFVLLSRLVTVRNAEKRLRGLRSRIFQLFNKSGSKAGSSAHRISDELPSTSQWPGSNRYDGRPMDLPPSNLRGRILANMAQMVRYDLGRFLPAEGRRCTLVVVARRPRRG